MIISIIPAGGSPQNPLFPGIYDPMIPINGKPAIDYILEQNKRRGAQKIVVLLSINDQQSIDYLSFRADENIIIVTSEGSEGLGKSIYSSKPYCNLRDSIIINLGDTLYAGSLDKENALLVSDRKVSETNKRCFVSESGLFINRPEKNIEGCQVVSGIYRIHDSSAFFNCLISLKYDFYGALYQYHNINSLIQIKEDSNWYDLGHIEEYYKSKIDFLRVRSFNSLSYDSFRGIITKKSSNKEKLKWEINRFLNLPNDLKVFAPRLIDFYVSPQDTYYSLEFYGYNSLADMFIFGSYPSSHREEVINKLLNLISYFKDNYHINNFPKQYGYDMYFTKTLKRFDMIRENKLFAKILNAQTCVINGAHFTNPIFTILDNLEDYCEGLYNNNDNAIVHGDMCFSNILFDNYNGIIKLIDPRGYFGDMGIYGDTKYDMAKLRHSIHGNYEYIVSDLFSLSYNLDKMEFSYTYFKKNNSELVAYFDKKIEQSGGNVQQILFIEGLLFLTMIPLHSDSVERQIMMLLTALQIFTSFLSQRCEK